MRSNGKYQGKWESFAANLTEQKSQCPFRQRTGTLLTFLMKIDKAAWAYGAATVLTKRDPREAVVGVAGEGDSPAATWLNRAA
eukprot:2864385-Pyramimonas_sp.AAC.1